MRGRQLEALWLVGSLGLVTACGGKVASDAVGSDRAGGAANTAAAASEVASERAANAAANGGAASERAANDAGNGGAFSSAEAEVDDNECEDATEEGTPGWGESHELCTITAALEVIAKRTPCTDADSQECWKGCGPNAIGFKKLTCTGGAYVEDQCEFDPNRDYSCFRIPAPEDVHPDCPTEEASAPRHNEACDVPPCQVCGGNIYEQTTGYRNSSEGLPYRSYCVCHPPVLDANGVVVWAQRWRCATEIAWPCPGGCGC